MKEFLKNIYYNMNFTPQIMGHPGEKKTIRPYWGVVVPGQLGGPVSRTRRMEEAFGNYKWLPNIIHVNSAWDPAQFLCAKRMKKRGMPMVFNQNGHYYPAWFSGDWRMRNQAMIECQKRADFVFFQSEFSKKTQLELTGYIPSNHMILLNSVPLKPTLKPWAPQGRHNVLLTGVFGKSSAHILEPALEAFHILSKKLGSDSPVLTIAGNLPTVTPLVQSLIDSGNLRLKGSYAPSDFQEVLKQADFALHLKYKDCCPNAVVEKMLTGIPLIYSDSGGTPELIGEAGIPLKVRETWDEMVSVDSTHLAHAVERMMRDGASYAQKTFDHAREAHNWERYISVYREIFERVLGNC